MHYYYILYNYGLFGGEHGAIYTGFKNIDRGDSFIYYIDYYY